MYLCTFRSEPGKRECLEMVWSIGRACKTCTVDCYRSGWDKKSVDLDNEKLVREKLLTPGTSHGTMNLQTEAQE
jgi:hypothetical protein